MQALNYQTSHAVNTTTYYEVPAIQLNTGDTKDRASHNGHCFSNSHMEKVPQAVDNSLSVRAQKCCTAGNSTLCKHGGGRLNHMHTSAQNPAGVHD
jgi:hypothetical protein